MELKKVGEFRLLQKLPDFIKKPAAKTVVVNIGDDAAVVKSEPGYEVFTCDSLVEEVHFKLSTISPFDLGYKCLAVNVSDIAAMAAKPRYALISLALPNTMKISFVEQFYQGLTAAAYEYGVDLIGGDLTSARQVTVTVTVIGFSLLKKQLHLRSQADPDELILVTGNLGASAAGLWLSLNPQAQKQVSQAANLLKAHFRPQARIKEALFLAKHGCQALADISDGLARDITNICLASGVGCLIEEAKLPVAEGVAEVAKLSGQDATTVALSGGEDYELVFTVKPSQLKTLLARTKAAKLKISVVGQIKKAAFGCQLLTKEKRLVPLIGGYNHFA